MSPTITQCYTSAPLSQSEQVADWVPAVISDRCEPCPLLADAEGRPIPDAARSELQQGQQHANSHELSAAIACYEAAIQRCPHYAAAYYELANIHQQLGNLDNALSLYQQVLSLNPNMAQVYCHLGAICQLTGKRDEAITAYQQAVSLNPTLAEIHCDLGSMFQQKGEQEAAIACFNAAIKNRLAAYNL